MDNQLININPDTKAVSMKELYAFLEIRENWTDWANRMLDYGFTQNVDYQAVSVFVPHPNGFGGTNKKDYALTLDTAKEICMIQRTPKGKQARQYFIEVEKSYKGEVKVKTPMELLAEANVIALQVLAERDKEVEQLKPKAEFYDMVTASDSSITFEEAAKLLGNIGRNKLFQRLRDLKVLNNNNLPYQQFMERQLFEVVESTWTDPDNGKVHVTTKTLFTQKGLDYVRKLMCMPSN